MKTKKEDSIDRGNSKEDNRKKQDTKNKKDYLSGFIDGLFDSSKINR
jgi:hypothetical protein